MSGAAEVNEADTNKLVVHYLTSPSGQQIGLSPPGGLSRLDEDDLDPCCHQKGQSWSQPRAPTLGPVVVLTRLAGQIHELTCS